MSYDNASLPNSSPVPDLINTAAFFQTTLRRSFTQQPREVLGELLQNSQRAGASQVNFSFPEPTLCIVSDNGNGIEGLSGLYALLRVCDSAYDDQEVAEQMPMGIGLYALFALDGLEEVTVESNGITFGMDVAQWFDDEDYRKSWFDRATEQADYAGPHGFALRIRGEAALLSTFKLLLLGEASNAWGWLVMSPAKGYTGILSVSVDNVELDTTLSDGVTLQANADIVDTYQGCPIRILFHREGGRRDGKLIVNWYGQVIEEYVSLPWDVYLEVRSGSPVHPKAPTRRDLIRDQTYTSLLQWIETRLFTFVCTAESPTAEHVALLYSINEARALDECPFALVQRWLPLPDLVQCCDNVLSSMRAGTRVIRKTDPVLLLGETVNVVLPDFPILESEESGHRSQEIVEFDYGLESFISATGLIAYRPVKGIAAEHFLWWRPGERVDGYHTTDLGMYGIGIGTDEPLSWHPLTEGNVYVFAQTTSRCLDDVEWFIGVKRTEDMVSFLQRYGWAVFVADEYSPESSESEFGESLADLARSYLHDAIDGAIPISVFPQIAGLSFSPGEQVSSIDFLYDEQGAWHQQICVHTRTGGARVLTLYTHTMP